MIKQSITDQWLKHEKALPRYTLTLLRNPKDHSAMGLQVTRNGVVVNEAWTAEACDQLANAGELNLFEAAQCPTCIDLEMMFNAGDADF